MLIEVGKVKATKLIMEHVQEELSTEEFHALLVKLLRLYKKFQNADVESLFSKRSIGD